MTIMISQSYYDNHNYLDTLGGGPERLDRTLRGASPKSFGRIPRTFDFDGKAMHAWIQCTRYYYAQEQELKAPPSLLHQDSSNKPANIISIITTIMITVMLILHIFLNTCMSAFKGIRR